MERKVILALIAIAIGAALVLIWGCHPQSGAKVTEGSPALDPNQTAAISKLKFELAQAQARQTPTQVKVVDKLGVWASRGVSLTALGILASVVLFAFAPKYALYGLLASGAGIVLTGMGVIGEGILSGFARFAAIAAWVVPVFLAVVFGWVLWRVVKSVEEAKFTTGWGTTTKESVAAVQGWASYIVSLVRGML